MNRRDADRVLGHSYTLEVGAPCEYGWCKNRTWHHHVEPYVFRWADVAKFVLGMVLLYGTVVSLVILGTVAQ